MGIFDAPGVLQKKSSSLISHNVDLPKSLSRDHVGLMSWPEQLYRPRQDHQHPDGINGQEDSLFARATQLSIFGSMVHDADRHNRSFTSHAMPSHSLSYPRISSRKGYPRVQSEGAVISNNQRGFTETKSTSPLPSSRREDHVHDDSSEEDELIVRIDSPSRLSFRRSSGHFYSSHH